MDLHQPQRSGCVWCRSSRDPSGSVRQGPPKTRFTHCSVSTLPGPVDASKVFTILDQHGPDSFEDALGDPSLHRAVNGTVVAKPPRKLVPLTTRSHLVNDAIECLPLAGPWAAERRARVEFVEDFLDDLPQFVVHLPNRRERFCLAFRSGHPWLLVSGPTDGYRLAEAF